MPAVVMARGRLLLVAYDGHPDHEQIVGIASLNQPRGRWMITVSGVVRYRRRRRAAARTLSKLAQAALSDRVIARAPVARREGIGGGVQTIPYGLGHKRQMPLPRWMPR